MRLKLFLYTLLFAFVTATLHLLALHFSLYWIFLWFDCLVHFFGGTMAAFLVMAVCYPRIPKQHSLLYVVVLVFCIGVAWEVFEYVFGLSSHELRYWHDTLSDLSFDTVGALFGGVLTRRILK